MKPLTISFFCSVCSSHRRWWLFVLFAGLNLFQLNRLIDIVVVFFLLRENDSGVKEERQYTEGDEGTQRDFRAACRVKARRGGKESCWS